MDKYIVKDLKYSGKLYYSRIGKVYEYLNNFNFEFIEGKSYLINSELGNGGWALSWILGGYIKKFDGIIKKNGIEINYNDLIKESYCIGLDHNKNIFSKSVKNKIINGFKKSNNIYFNNIKEIIEYFDLNPERINKPLYYYSGEIWRASIAVGIANGKKIFCFPWINPEIIKLYENYWIKDILIKLKKFNTIILFPSKKTNESDKIFDEIIDLNVDFLEHNKR